MEIVEIIITVKNGKKFCKNVKCRVNIFKEFLVIYFPSEICCGSIYSSTPELKVFIKAVLMALDFTLTFLEIYQKVQTICKLFLKHARGRKTNFNYFRIFPSKCLYLFGWVQNIEEQY